MQTWEKDYGEAVMIPVISSTQSSTVASHLLQLMDFIGSGRKFNFKGGEMFQEMVAL